MKWTTWIAKVKVHNKACLTTTHTHTYTLHAFSHSVCPALRQYKPSLCMCAHHSFRFYFIFIYLFSLFCFYMHSVLAVSKALRYFQRSLVYFSTIIINILRVRVVLLMPVNMLNRNSCGQRQQEQQLRAALPHYCVFAVACNCLWENTPMLYGQRRAPFVNATWVNANMHEFASDKHFCLLQLQTDLHVCARNKNIRTTSVK